MARLFVRLKLQLIAGNLRASAGRQAGFALSATFAVLLAGFGFLLTATLRLAEDAEVAAGVAVLVFTGFALVWVLLPVLAFGVDETLDPARLALLPLTRRDLAVGLAASSAVGIWPPVTLVVLLGIVVGVAPSAVGAVVGLAAVAVEYALCVVLARAVTTSLARVLRSRRGRDFLLVAGVAITLLAQLPNLLVNDRIGVTFDRGAFDRLVAALEWAPPGMAARALDTANPLWLVLPVLVVVLVGWWWIAVLARSLVAVDASTQGGATRSVRHGHGHGRGPGDGHRNRPRWVPSGQLGGVVVKELIYLRREPRRAVGVVMAVAMTLILAFGQGSDTGLAFPTGLGAVILGLQSVNVFGSDGSAFWMNTSAWLTSRDVRVDLAGRHLATAVVAVPALVGATAGAAAITGQGSDLASALAISLALLGIALGATAVASALMPYTLPERANAFSGAAPGQGGAALAGTLGVLVASVALGLPIIVLAVVDAPAPVLLVAGPVYGGLLAWAGRVVAAGIAYPRLPEILAAVSRSS